jgi:hypothetical protein
MNRDMPIGRIAIRVAADVAFEPSLSPIAELRKNNPLGFAIRVLIHRRCEYRDPRS